LHDNRYQHTSGYGRARLLASLELWHEIPFDDANDARARAARARAPSKETREA